MQLQKQKQSHVLYSGQKNESIGMSLDMDSAQVLMQMLSKNLYSDAIGSTIRECASNALDSHRRARVNKPIVVSLVQNDSNNWEFTVEDFGTGLDHDDVQNIISKYGKSTKRDSDTELGMMGLGFKAPLAYASSFYFTCRKNGIERKYMMYEGEDTNTIDLISEQVTMEENGVKVIVPIRWGDKYDFLKKIKQQLAYFEDVYFNVDDVDNNFSIHRSKLYQFSELADDDKLHICLDNVYYPLDFDKMGMDTIYLPIGVRFSLTDGIFPTPNRESLIYTKDTKDAIKAKITELANSYVDKYNENVTDSEDVHGFLHYYYHDTRELEIFGKKFDLKAFKDFITTPFAQPKLEGVNFLDVSTWQRYDFSNLLAEYKTSHKFENGRMYTMKENHWGRDQKWSSSDSRDYIMQGPMRGHKKAYLREQAQELIDTNASNNKYRVYFIRKITKTPLYDGAAGGNGGANSYYKYLKLANYPKSQWRDVIKEFQYIESLLLKDLIDADAIEVPQDWIDDRKANTVSKMRATKAAKGEKVEGDFNCKKAEDLLRYNDGRKCKFTSHRINIKDVEEGTHTYVYAHHDDYMLLDNLYEETECLPIKYITFSKRELDALEKSPAVDNLVPYSEFIKGHDLFIKFMTAYKCKKFISKWDDIFDKKLYIKDIKDSLSDKLDLIENYRDMYIRRGRYQSHPTASEFSKEDDTVYNDQMCDLMQELSEFFTDNPYIYYMSSALAYGDKSKLIDCLAQLFKYNGVSIRTDYVLLKNRD